MCVRLKLNLPTSGGEEIELCGNWQVFGSVSLVQTNHPSHDQQTRDEISTWKVCMPKHTHRSFCVHVSTYLRMHVCDVNVFCVKGWYPSNLSFTAILHTLELGITYPHVETWHVCVGVFIQPLYVSPCRELAWHDLAFFNSNLYEGLRRMLLDAQEKRLSLEEFKSTYCCYFEVRVVLFYIQHLRWCSRQHLWRNRLARSAVNRKVVGSSPTRCVFFLFFSVHPGALR